MFTPADHLDSLLTLARTAGEAIMRFRDEGFETIKKTDGSPVTLADQASEDIIIAGLQSLTPSIPVIAEEQAEAGLSPQTREADTFWLVDPLDGTKEFIKGSDDFAINIGLIRHGIPVFGLVHIPATGDIYYGGAGIGAFLNDSNISTLPYNREDGLVMIGSASHPDSDKGRLRAAMLEGHIIQRYTTRGSGIKFCLIADGTAHLYPRFVPTYEWDTAAAHAMLLQVGGDIIDVQTKQRLTYGKAGYRNGNLVTGTNEVLELLAIRHTAT